MLGINIAILIFVSVIMPMKGMEADINEVPKLIPVMSICGILLPLFLMLAIWPVWGFLSPIYIFVLCFGYIFALSFLPGGKFGTLVFWVLMIGGATLSHELPHADIEHAW